MKQIVDSKDFELGWYWVQSRGPHSQHCIVHLQIWDPKNNWFEAQAWTSWEEYPGNRYSFTRDQDWLDKSKDVYQISQAQAETLISILYEANN